MSYIFEPHGGYGTCDDEGTPFPFGYLSDAPGQPVFELSTIFEKPVDELHSRVRILAAAPDLLAMLKVAQLWLDVDGRYDMQGINAAISKAEALPSPSAEGRG